MRDSWLFLYLLLWLLHNSRQSDTFSCRLLFYSANRCHFFNILHNGILAMPSSFFTIIKERLRLSSFYHYIIIIVQWSVYKDTTNPRMKRSLTAKIVVGQDDHSPNTNIYLAIAERSAEGEKPLNIVTHVSFSTRVVRQQPQQQRRPQNSQGNYNILDIFIHGATRGLTWVQACPQTPASSCPLLILLFLAGYDDVYIKWRVRHGLDRGRGWESTVDEYT